MQNTYFQIMEIYLWNIGYVCVMRVCNYYCNWNLLYIHKLLHFAPCKSFYFSSVFLLSCIFSFEPALKRMGIILSLNKNYLIQVYKTYKINRLLDTTTKRYT